MLILIFYVGVFILIPLLTRPAIRLSAILGMTRKVEQVERQNLSAIGASFLLDREIHVIKRQSLFYDRMPACWPWYYLLPFR